MTGACQPWFSQGRLGHHLLLWLASHGSPRGDWGITCYRGLPAVALLETRASPVTVACQPWLSQGRLGHHLRLGLASRGSPRGDWGISRDWGLPGMALQGETGASPGTGTCLAVKTLHKRRKLHHMSLMLLLVHEQ